MEESYFCNECQIRLCNKYSYATHIKSLSHIKNSSISEKNKYCSLCDYTTNKLCNFRIHLKSKKHLKAEAEAESNYKNETTRYSCEACEFYTNIKRDYLYHTKTNKHISMNATNEKQLEEKCLPCDSTVQLNTINYSSNDLIPLFMEVIKQNAEIKNSVIGLCKTVVENSGENHHNTNTNNSHNTQNFNINIFLNETCKNAININDFIESLKIDSDSIEYLGREGYVEGMTKIFVDGLRQMQVEDRPIHCTDVKRETFYIRDSNTWMKDNDKKKIESAINKVINKNQRNLHLWREKNPLCEVMNTREYEFYFEIMQQCIGGGQDKEALNNRKIIKNLAKFTSVDKIAKHDAIVDGE